MNLKTIFSSTVYVQLSSEKIYVCNIEDKTTFEERPYIAIDRSSGKEMIHSVGDSAFDLKGNGLYKVTNPFDHPRVLVSNFYTAEKVLVHAVRSVRKTKFFAPKPLMVIHPLEKLEGGVTDIECRVYRELALGAGARQVLLHVGAKLDTFNFNLKKVVEPESNA